MKTRIITSIFGLALLAVVLCLFNTPVFEIVVALICLIAVHEIYEAFDLGKRGPWVFGGFSVYTVLLILSAAAPEKLLIAPISFLFVLYLAICLIWFNQNLNVARLSGVCAVGVVIWTAFYSLVFIKARLPVEEYGYEAVYLILMALAFAWGGDTFAYFTGRLFGKHKLAPLVSPHKTVEAPSAASWAPAWWVCCAPWPPAGSPAMLRAACSAISRCSCWAWAVRCWASWATFSLRLSSASWASRTTAPSSPAMAGCWTASTA